DDREGVATEPFLDDDFDDDTAWMNVDLPLDTAVSAREKNLLGDMRRTLANVNMQQCDTCHERAFDLAIRRESNECSRCHADKHENGKQWSDANNVNPSVQPPCLKGLTDIEEMLIARIKPIMHVRYTTG
ncbi:hypothetical protein BGY98DRAFT_890421, partial [Russula aff. rugulosa BPL654]